MSHARLVLELGASLARLRRDYDRALDRIDVLEAQLAAARAALAAVTRTAEPLCDQA